MEKIERRIALKEIKSFVKEFDGKEPSEQDIEDRYPDILDAVISGHLVFDQGKPVFDLRKPLTHDDPDLCVNQIKFRTRIKPSDLSNISKGLDITKNQMEYLLRCNSYISGVSKSELDLLDKFDYKVVEQICSVFL